MDYTPDIERQLADREKNDYGSKNVSDSSSACLGSAMAPTSASRPYRPQSGEVGEVRDVIPDFIRQKEAEGEANFKRLGWKRLTIVLIVEAIALGSLSLPAAFATLGMVAGVICSVGLGIAAVYSSYVVGQLKLKYPEI